MKKEKILTTVLLLIAVFVFTGFAYAYLAGGISNANRQEATITTGTMNLTFRDGTTSLAATSMTIGTSVTKTFTIENTGTLEGTASMYFKDLINTYMAESMSYRLEYATSENGTYSVLQAETNVPQSSTVSEKLLYGNITVPAGTKLYYKLIITFNNLPNVDQTADVNAVLNTKFTLKAGHTIESESDITLAALGLTANSGTPDFTQMPAEESGIYSAEDNFGTSFYFRGNVTNNYVKFGTYLYDGYYSISPDITVEQFGNYYLNESECQERNENCYYHEFPNDLYWRIIRIVGDGSIRMIYDGSTPHENGVASTDRFAMAQAQAYGNYDTLLENWISYSTLSTRLEQYIISDKYLSGTEAPPDDICDNYDNSHSYSAIHGEAMNGYPSLIGRYITNNSKIFSHLTINELIMGGGATGQTFLTKGNRYMLADAGYADCDQGGHEYGLSDFSLWGFNPAYIAPVITISKEAARSLIGTGIPGDPFRLS